MEFEFKVQPKTVKLTLGKESHVGRFPFQGELVSFLDELSKVKQEEAPALCDKFLVDLGFPKKALNQLDVEDYKTFLEYVMWGGKKNSNLKT